MNDKEIILMLEAQIRNYRRLLVDPQGRIRKLREQYDSKIKQLERRIASLESLTHSLEAQLHRAKSNVVEVHHHHKKRDDDDGFALGFLDMGGPV